MMMLRGRGRNFRWFFLAIAIIIFILILTSPSRRVHFYGALGEYEPALVHGKAAGEEDSDYDGVPHEEVQHVEGNRDEGKLSPAGSPPRSLSLLPNNLGGPDKSSKLSNGQVAINRNLSVELPKKSEHRIEDTDSKACAPKVNFVYIKMIKCASQTLVSIFRRFGHKRNLSFVLPVGKKIYLGWPYLIEPDFYRPSKTGTFNILCDHSVFDEKRMRGIMPADSVFITSIREPYSQFKSMFRYYELKKILNITYEPPIVEYLNQVEKYDAIYKSPSAAKLRHCIPNGFSMSKNLMSFNLGFPTGYPAGTPDKTKDLLDANYMYDWLSYIERQFSLVMIVEYLHPSLVLLRRMMCWDLYDVIYVSQNVANYTYKSSHDVFLQDKYKQWSSVDFALYDHFNRTLWKKISNSGPDFWDEVQHLDNLVRYVSAKCNETSFTYIEVAESPWNKAFRLDQQDCAIMKKEILTTLQTKYDKTPPSMKQPVTKVNFC